jgi:hypothetical protein
MACNGECLSRCQCKCSTACSCEHKNHNGYCPSICCIPKPCLYCSTTRPQWLLDINNLMCSECNHELIPILGRHKNTNQVEQCCVCLDDKRMTVLKCKHSLCHMCWYKIALSAYEKGESPQCPLCRHKNIIRRV